MRLEIHTPGESSSERSSQTVSTTHLRMPHAPMRRVSACHAALFAAMIRHPRNTLTCCHQTLPRASATPTCNPRAQPPVASTPTRRTTSTTFFTEFQEFWGLRLAVSFLVAGFVLSLKGLLPGCFSVRDHLTDFLRDLLRHDKMDIKSSLDSLVLCQLHHLHELCRAS